MHKNSKTCSLSVFKMIRYVEKIQMNAPYRAKLQLVNSRETLCINGFFFMVFTSFKTLHRIYIYIFYTTPREHIVDPHITCKYSYPDPEKKINYTRQTVIIYVMMLSYSRSISLRFHVLYIRYIVFTARHCNNWSAVGPHGLFFCSVFNCRR